MEVKNKQNTFLQIKISKNYTLKEKLLQQIKKSYAIFSQSFFSVQGLQNKSNDKSFSDFHCNRIINYTFFDADKFKDRCESDWMSNYDTNFIPFHSDPLSSEHIMSTAMKTIHRLAYPQRRGSLTVRQGLAVVIKSEAEERARFYLPGTINLRAQGRKPYS